MYVVMSRDQTTAAVIPYRRFVSCDMADAKQRPILQANFYLSSLYISLFYLFVLCPHILADLVANLIHIQPQVSEDYGLLLIENEPKPAGQTSEGSFSVAELYHCPFTTPGPFSRA